MTYIPQVKETLCILGDSSTGKTTTIIREAIRLAQTGTGTVLVLSASPNSAIACRRQVSAALQEAGLAADAVEVTSVRALAVDLLGTPAALAFTGRAPRVLTSGEEDVLMEDLKSCGMAAKRVREMFKFFRKSFTELADAEPGFIVASDEQNLMDLFNTCMGSYNAMLECEVSAQAVKYLRNAAATGQDVSAFNRAHVLVDDYETLSVASQELVARIATASLTVAGNPDFRCGILDSYPNFDGLSQMAEAAKQTQVLEQSFQPADLQAVGKRLTAEATRIVCGDDVAVEADVANVGDGSVVRLCFDTPEKELRGVSAKVKELIDGGTAPSDILVATSTGTWLKNLNAALKAAGVPIAPSPVVSSLAVRFGNIDKNAASRALAMLGLVADRQDGLCWRMLIGMDDEVTNAAVFKAIRGRAEELPNAPITDLIEDFASRNRGVPAVPLIVACRAKVEKVAGLCEGKTGAEVLQIVCDQMCMDQSKRAQRILTTLVGDAEGQSAADMYNTIRAAISVPTAVEGDGVKVGMFEDAFGVGANTVLIAGFVNGFFPHANYFADSTFSIDQREKMHRANVDTFRRLVGSTRRSLIVSSFKEAAIEAAGQLNLKIGRIRMRNDQRVCSIQTSDFDVFLG